MTTHPRSHSSRTSGDIKQLLIPPTSQLLLNLVLAALILLALNARAVWHYFTRGINENSRVELGDLIQAKAPALYDFVDSVTHGRLVQILFWLFVGCIVYLIIWSIGNFFTNIRNDIVADEYVHPSSYDRTDYWSSVLARKVVLACTIFVLVAYTYAGAKLIILLADLCYRSVLEFSWLDTTITFAGCLIATTLVLQIFAFLWRFVINSWGIVYRDL